MEGKKILDLSNLSDEHFDSVQKAVYRCMGSNEPGDFAFATHKECEDMLNALRKAFTTTFNKGVICGAIALVSGCCIGYVIDKACQKARDKKKEKELFGEL